MALTKAEIVVGQLGRSGIQGLVPIQLTGCVHMAPESCRGGHWHFHIDAAVAAEVKLYLTAVGVVLNGKRLFWETLTKAHVVLFRSSVPTFHRAIMRLVRMPGGNGPHGYRSMRRFSKPFFVWIENDDDSDSDVYPV